MSKALQKEFVIESIKDFRLLVEMLKEVAEEVNVVSVILESRKFTLKVVNPLYRHLCGDPNSVSNNEPSCRHCPKHYPKPCLAG